MMWVQRSDYECSPYREKRFQVVRRLIKSIIDRKGKCVILDMGGTYGYWNVFSKQLDGLDVEVTILNLEAAADRENAKGDPRFTFQAGDACQCPQFGDNQFDLVHSNSVLEHVGGWKQMSAMADEIRRLAPAYYVQTPNYWFPIEPHFRTPLIHWLPRPAQLRLVMSARLGFYKKAPDINHAMATLEDATLLNAAQMRALFPDAQLQREKFFGLTKSLMAIRAP